MVLSERFCMGVRDPRYYLKRFCMGVRDLRYYPKRFCIGVRDPGTIRKGFAWVCERPLVLSEKVLYGC